MRADDKDDDDDDDNDDDDDDNAAAAAAAVPLAMGDISPRQYQMQWKCCFNP